MDDRTGTIYLCTTPIGNLEDITLRVLRVLKEVDYIAAEDTRHTLKLLNHFEIKKPLVSYHEHNKHERGRELIELVKQGKSIALVSDAGMPGISDPGHDMVVMAAEEDIPVTLLPGASASLTALVLSALPTDRFVFEGFLPRDKKLRNQRMEALKKEERTIILYESPHRIAATLELLAQELGDRKAALARELTKIHETVLRTTLMEGAAFYKNHPAKGEFVVIIEGAPEEKEAEARLFSDMDIGQHLQMYLDEGMEKKEAIKKVARERGIPKNEVYKYSF